MKNRQVNGVMVLSNSFGPDLRVYKEAKSLMNKGHRVTIIAWDRECKYRKTENFDGILVKRFHIRASYGTGVLKLDKLVLFLIYAARLIKSGQFDYVHCHDLDTLPVGVYFKLFCTKSVIYDAHENFSKMILMSSPHFLSYAVMLLERLFINFVDSIIVASTAFGNELIEKTEKPVTVIGNWQDLPNLDSRTVREIRNRIKGKYHLLITYIGGLDKSRSLIPMMQAMKAFKEFKFAIYGNGVQRNVIRQMAAGMKNVSFMGTIPQEMVTYYTAASDVIYYVMDYSSAIANYNAPNSLGFALVNGCAVIASNNGELGLIVQNEGCGVVVRDNSVQAIQGALEILRNKGKLAQIKRNALIAGKNKYNWSNMAHKLIMVYDEVMRSKYSE